MASGFSRFPEIETGTFSLRQARNMGPTMIVVWRTDCPTCRLTIPFIDRLAKRFRTATIVGFAQDTQADLDEYQKANGLTMRNISDANLAVSSGLKVSTVPAYWLLDRHGEILVEGLGWKREEIEAVAAKLAAMTSQPYAPLITAADEVPVFKPG